MTSQDLENYVVRTMLSAEVEEAFTVINKEGWNLTLEKYAIMYQNCPDKSYVILSPDGDLIGTTNLYPTFDGEYVVGHVVIKEGHRGQGVGRQLLTDVIARNPNTVLSLLAVPGADQFYVRMGFQLTQPQQGHVIFHLTIDKKVLEDRIKDTNTDVSILPYTEKDFDTVVAYDREARGYLNKGYVAMQAKCFTVIVAKNSEGHLLGFGVSLVKCGEIVLDGLYADSDDVALRLIIGVLKAFPERTKLKIQVPSSQLYLSTLGTVTSSYSFTSYSLGQPTPFQTHKVYNVADCGYTLC